MRYTHISFHNPHNNKIKQEVNFINNFAQANNLFSKSKINIRGKIDNKGIINKSKLCKLDVSEC